MTAWLVAVLGSERVVDRTADADRSMRPLLRSLTRHPTWASDQLPANLGLAVGAKVGALLLGVAVLTWLATAAGSRLTAFLAGWAATVVSSALAGLTFVVTSNVLRPELSSNDVVSAVVEVNRGAAFGLYTGWLVGMAIAAVPMCRSLSSQAGPSPRRRRRRGTPAPPAPEPAAPPPPPATTWPPRPPIGTVLPNPAWTAAGHHQDPERPPIAAPQPTAGPAAR
jgi:hypothetical protein